ncbi:DUF4148 domain-containing protein [Caballeronia sp. dw_276]|uniref:DUF4148 domain-containing protein n=1 Tax=Caballeronia sp. dw_276 TaxID=2719795 RepID=UPI0021046927|nr:DUF4148 domain-containing protein [Caballeronia sp. dw_276]
MLKAIIPAIALAAAIGAPTLANAQQSGDTVTRAAVKADLVQLEQSGYNVEGDHTTYPAQAQAAEQSGNKSRRDGDIVRTDREWFVRSRNAITRRSARRRAVDLFRAIT